MKALSLISKTAFLIGPGCQVPTFWQSAALDEGAVVLGSYYGIRPRANIEMKLLKDRAEELIVLLKEEYPE